MPKIETLDLGLLPLSYKSNVVLIPNPVRHLEFSGTEVDKIIADYERDTGNKVICSYAFEGHTGENGLILEFEPRKSSGGIY